MDSNQVTLSPDDGLPKALELKAAAILVLLAAILIGAVFYVMYARGVFEKSRVLSLIAEDAAGIQVGMDMTFAGFSIGRVTRVSLHEDGRARLRVEIPEKQGKWLRETSVFVLEKGLIGSSQLKAYTGLLEGPLLPDGAERTVLFGDVSAQIPQITLAARELLENLSSMTDGNSALAATLNNLRITTARLNAKHGALGVLMGNDQDAAAVAATMTTAQELVKTLEGLVASADLMVRSTNTMIGNADQQIFGQQGLLPEVQASVSNLTQLLAQLRQSMLKVDDILATGQGIAADTKEATADLVSLRAEVEASLRKVDAMVNELNTKWPLSRQVEIKLP